MIFFLGAVVTGLAAGLLRGGSLGNLAELHIRRVWLALGAVGLQATLPLLSASARHVVLVASYAAAGAFVLSNWPGRRPALRVGVALLGLGWALNALVVGLNGAMPVSLHAAERIGVPPEDVARHGLVVKHVHADTSTTLPQLGDVIPVAIGPVKAVVNVGDLLLLGGIAVVFAASVASDGRAPATGRLARRDPRFEG